eukprot:1385642-Amorphochlora_amoeboformis.AAC.1
MLQYYPVFTFDILLFLFTVPWMFKRGEKSRKGGWEGFDTFADECAFVGEDERRLSHELESMGGGAGKVSNIHAICWV